MMLYDYNILWLNSVLIALRIFNNDNTHIYVNEHIE